MPLPKQFLSSRTTFLEFSGPSERTHLRSSPARVVARWSLPLDLFDFSSCAALGGAGHDGPSGSSRSASSWFVPCCSGSHRCALLAEVRTPWSCSLDLPCLSRRRARSSLSRHPDIRVHAASLLPSLPFPAFRLLRSSSLGVVQRSPLRRLPRCVSTPGFPFGLPSAR